jgi:DNA adenine methylase
MLISYNSSQLIRDRFDGWTVAEFAHTYTMRSTGCYNKEQASRKELVLINYEV